jgi:hypothetical protein
MSNLTWSYGITTIPIRKYTLLPRTLESLRIAGFNEPRLFMDGIDTDYTQLYQYQVSQRDIPLKAVGNWILSAWELYLRNPLADRYAIFQDDLITYKNLRQYLDICPFPNKGYLNLYTWPMNYKLSPDERILQNIPNVNKGIWYKSNQWGKGALGLVFDNDGFRTLLNSPILLNKPRAEQWADRNIDGMVMEAMYAKDYFEYVHDPSLLQHIGIESSMGSKDMPIAPHFKGESLDAMSLL